MNPTIKARDIVELITELNDQQIPNAEIFEAYQKIYDAQPSGKPLIGTPQYECFMISKHLYCMQQLRNRYLTK